MGVSRWLAGAVGCGGAAAAYDYTTQHKMRKLHRQWDPYLAWVRYGNMVRKPCARSMGVDELSKHDGRDGVVYFAAGGWVYDVSCSEAFKKVYPGWAGQDASMSLCRLSMKKLDTRTEMLEWGRLTATDKKVLTDWVAYFDQKYQCVGTLREWNDATQQKKA